MVGMKLLLTILGILYGISPYDLVPDFLLGWGWLDDIALLYLLWRYVLSPATSRPHPAENDTTEQPSRDAAPRSPHEVLGVSPGADQEEIARAYHELARQYHPDMVAHLGQEFQELAEKRFREINEAYEQLTSSRH